MIACIIKDMTHENRAALRAGLGRDSHFQIPDATTAAERFSERVSDAINTSTSQLQRRQRGGPANRACDGIMTFGTPVQYTENPGENRHS